MTVDQTTRLTVDQTTRSDFEFETSRIARDIDEACDRFEAAWRAGGRPRIEDFVGSSTNPGRCERLRHLLAVEFAYRGGLGETIEASEYRRRFPGHDGLIDSIFAEPRRQPWVVHGAVSETLEVRLGRDGPWSGRALVPPPSLLPNIPGYEILSELGRGGMAVVYKARQLRLNRLCALKMILPGEHAGAELPVRLLAEAETIARIRHPNVVQIYGLGDHDGRLYFEMEYIEGATSPISSTTRSGHTNLRRTWSRSWPAPSSTPIAWGSSTATSSRPTSC